MPARRSASAADELGGQVEGAGAVVDQDEVVLGAVALDHSQ